MTDLLRFSIPSKPEYVGVARLAISSIANRAGFDYEAIEDIKVAVAEGCTNAICHGKNSECQNYDIECTVETNKLIIQIKDNGCGFDTAKYSEPNLEVLKEKGMGIYIIKTLMDEVEVLKNNNSGTILKMTKYI